jgi:hypothetical protein
VEDAVQDGAGDGAVVVECGFRRNRTPVPIHIGHRFRLISDSCRSEATLWG